MNLGEESAISPFCIQLVFPHPHFTCSPHRALLTLRYLSDPFPISSDFSYSLSLLLFFPSSPAVFVLSVTSYILLDCCHPLPPPLSSVSDLCLYLLSSLLSSLCFSLSFLSDLILLPWLLH